METVWLIGAASIGFLVSFTGVGRASLPRDWFVLAHLIVSGGFCFVYGRYAGLNARDLVSRPAPGLAGAVAAGLIGVLFVVGQPSSPSPSGAALAWGLVWLGAVYGTVDTLLLSVVPVVAVRRASMRWARDSRHRPLATNMLALCASLVVTASYHLGFPEFRGPELIAPLIGNGLFTLAYLVTGSPLAPLLAHVALHVIAILHAYSLSVPLPPHYA